MGQVFKGNASEDIDWLTDAFLHLLPLRGLLCKNYSYLIVDCRPTEQNTSLVSGTNERTKRKPEDTILPSEVIVYSSYTHTAVIFISCTRYRLHVAEEKLFPETNNSPFFPPKRITKSADPPIYLCVVLGADPPVIN